MINFFRKIRKKLADDNPTSAKASAGMKTGKYLSYAIGEIILVVIGILIALQINNWNEERKDRRIEKSILIELKDNLERNLVLIDNATAELIEINQTTRAIIEIMENRMSFSDTLIHDFDQMFRSGSYILELNTNGYESLKNLGLEILSSKTLKNDILSLFEISYPSYIKHTEVRSAIWGSNPRSWYNYFYIRPSESGMIPLDFNSLTEDKKFMTIVRDLEFGRYSVLEKMKLCQTETHRVLQQIKSVLDEME